MGFAATILTLYPEMFPGPLGVSLAGRALERGDWSCETVQIRDFATDKHRTVDDTPAGGGAGMVLKPDVLCAAIASVGEGRPILAMTPRGAPPVKCAARRPPPWLPSLQPPQDDQHTQQHPPGSRWLGPVAKTTG